MPEVSQPVSVDAGASPAPPRSSRPGQSPPANAALLNIPDELRDRDQWVCWIHGMRNGKLTKKPIDPKTGGNAKSNDRSTWGSFKTAVVRYELKELNGVGFVFSEDDPYCGIDLDACRNPGTGELTDWAKRIVDQIPGYWEISPSTFGIKGIFRARIKPGHNVKKLKDVPTFGDKEPEIALYDHGRFFCITGMAL